LNRFDPAREEFRSYKHDPDDPSSLSHDTVMSVLQDHSGRLWISTAGGLNLFDPASESFTHYREADGLPNDFVYGALEDPDGNLWMSTNNGISKFTPESGEFRNYGPEDGVQSTEFMQGAYFQNEDGEMFFGGVNGFNIFDPEMVVDNLYIPPVVVTDFQLFNSSVAPGSESPLQASTSEADEITLDYEQDFFGFEFASMHYSAPSRNQYAYILEGLDRDWNYVGNRRYAGYTNVPPGSYTFRVIGSNSDGVWNDVGDSIAVTVTPPFWQTWWFRMIAVVALGALAVGAYRLRVRSHEIQRQNLETQVDEKTRELQETLLELQRSKDAAESANRAKSVFLANMSHELRTPLNAILGFSQLMLRNREGGARHGDLDESERENLEVIVRSGEHLLGLINEVLEMSKIEAGRVSLNDSVFNLHRMLQGLEDMFRLRAEQKGIAMNLILGPDVPQYVCADEGKLRQILMNLLGNAVKFTSTGSVTLDVDWTDPAHGVSPEVDAGEGARRMRFQVVDTGVGIAQEDLARIFDPFIQASIGSEAQEGTGLGLSISLQFAHLMGGDLSAISGQGRGSTFILDVPIQLAEVPTVHVEQPLRRVVGLEDGQPRYRILIVDDKEVNRQLLVKMLEPFGFSLREAINGKQAIEQWEAWDPHLILMDMRMPVMDGYEATRKIRATTKGNATVIVALTASALEEDRVVILSEGCDAYIRKPFRESELYEALEIHLGVRFEYDERLPAVEPSDGRGDGTPVHGSDDLVTHMAHLSSDAMLDLERATLIGDQDKILAAIRPIADTDFQTGAALRRYALDYNHDTILSLIEAAQKMNQSERDE
jgi:signal transduction histidine kinase/ActR/RegA family two-component response regulator